MNVLETQAETLNINKVIHGNIHGNNHGNISITKAHHHLTCSVVMLPGGVDERVVDDVPGHLNLDGVPILKVVLRGAAVQQYSST